MFYCKLHQNVQFDLWRGDLAVTTANQSGTYVFLAPESKQCLGIFINIADLAEAACFGIIALSTGRRIIWDAESMKALGDNVPHEFMALKYGDGAV